MGEDPQTYEDRVNAAGKDDRAGGQGDLRLPVQRENAVQSVLQALVAAERIVITTHVNADGDGVGSQIALAGWLRMRDAHVRIVNPTKFPESFRFLVDDDELIANAGTSTADRALADCELIVVLDTAEADRIGRVAKAATGRPLVIIDHHVASSTALRGEALVDASACATGELIFDLLLGAGLPRPWPPRVSQGIYTAIVTDTGSFRFANTTQRAHNIAGDLIAQGVDPELMYRRIYATVPRRRLDLLRHALESLEVDATHPITWITIDRHVMQRLGTTSDDLEGVVEHARSVEGTEVAILFRETADGSTKVSLRSAGATDVNAVARQFGGGGHVKAAGALIAEPPATARPRIIAAVRAALDEAGSAAVGT